jgi:hypothetical protein
MAINIPIRVNKNKYGFITENARVHDNSNLDDVSYGATNFGEKGLGNHDSLNSIFNHPNSIVNGGSDNSDKDSIVASAFLQGRNDLSGKELADEIAAALEIISGKKDERQRTLAAQNPPGDSGTDPVFQKLLADEATLNGIVNDATNDPEELSALLVSSEFEYNPDFPLSNVNFGYGPITTETSRAKDLHGRISAAPRSPNINFPSLNSSLNDNEAQAEPDTDIQGLDGQGGFGSTELSSFNTSAMIATILNRYI